MTEDHDPFIIELLRTLGKEINHTVELLRLRYPTARAGVSLDPGVVLTWDKIGESRALYIRRGDAPPHLLQNCSIATRLQAVGALPKLLDALHHQHRDTVRSVKACINTLTLFNKQLELQKET